MQGFRNQIPVEWFDAFYYLELQENGSHYIVDVEQAEERFLLAHLRGMCSAVSYFAHIVDCHHYPFVTDEFLEWFPFHQLVERGTFRDIKVLHLVERMYDVLQCSSGTDGREVGHAYL